MSACPGHKEPRYPTLVAIPLSLCWVLLLSIVVFAGNAFPQQADTDVQLRPLPLEELFALPKVGAGGWGPIALSPDGELVAYPVCSAHRNSVELDPRYKTITRAGVPRIFEGCQLQITNTRNRETTTLLPGRNSWFPVWSPNGRTLAFYSDHDGIANLWLWHRTTSKSVKVSSIMIRSSGRLEPKWMPDSNGIVATTLPAGMTLDEVTSMGLGGVRQTDTTKMGETQSSVVVYTAGGTSQTTTKATAFDTSQFLSDLVLFDLAAKTTRTIATRMKIWGFRNSPDGKSVAFTSEAGFKSPASHSIVRALHIYDVATKRTRNAVNNFEVIDGRSYSWSPDSRNIAYCSSGDKGNCFVLSRDGGEPRNVTPGDHPSFSRIDRLPLWDPQGESFYVLSLAHANSVAHGHVKADSDGIWRIDIKEPSVRKIARTPDRRIIDVGLPSRSDRVLSADNGRTLPLLTIDDQSKRFGIYRVDLITGTTACLYEKDEVISNGSVGMPTYSLDVSADGKLMTYIVEDSQHPAELYVSDAEFRNPRQLTSAGKTIEKIPMGKTKLIEWRGYDGNLYQGAVLLPSGYREGQVYPTIVYPYPGDARSNYINLFGMYSSGAPIDNMQIFATRGYVVFLPDMPAPKVGRPMHSLVEGILPAINKIIDLGIADPDRLGVMGHSYGGYMVLSFIVQTNRFKAAVARAGIYDLVAEYGYLRLNGATPAPAWAETGQGSMGGTPWEFRERYIENSPFLYLDRVETPLLLIHGAEDSFSAVYTADQVFVGMRRLGKEIEYAKYPGEEHYEPSWGYANQLDYLTRIINWFDKHLKRNSQKTSVQAHAQP